MRFLRRIRRASGDTDSWIGEPLGYVRPPTRLDSDELPYTGREMGEDPRYSGRNMTQLDLTPIDDLRDSFFPPYTIDEASSAGVHTELSRISSRPELKLEPPPSAPASMSQTDAFPDSPLIQIDPPEGTSVSVRQPGYSTKRGTVDTASLSPYVRTSAWIRNPFRDSAYSYSTYAPSTPIESTDSLPLVPSTRSGPHSQTPSLSLSSHIMRRSRVPSVSGIGYSNMV